MTWRIHSFINETELINPKYNSSCINVLNNWYGDFITAGKDLFEEWFEFWLDGYMVEKKLDKDQIKMLKDHINVQRNIELKEWLEYILTYNNPLLACK